MTAASVRPDTPLARVLAKLPLAELDDRGYVTYCPVHERDGNYITTLTFFETRDRRVQFECARGCKGPAIASALGLPLADLFVGAPGALFAPEPAEPPASPPPPPAQPVLVEDNGDILYRFAGGNQAALYRPEALQLAVAEGRQVFIVEDEIEAMQLADVGYVATTVHPGLAAWSETFAPTFKGGNVVIIPRNDELARTDANQVAASLHAIGCTVRVLALPVAVEAGLAEFCQMYPDDALDRLSELVDTTPRWFPDIKGRIYFRVDELWDHPALAISPVAVVPRFVYQGMSTLAAAREKNGKSTVLGLWTAAVTTGADFLGQPCMQGDVVIFSLEEDWKQVVRRLRYELRIACDPKRIHLITGFLTADRMAEVRSRVEQHNPVLLLVDSLVAFKGDTEADLNDAEVAQVVYPLTHLAHDANCGLALVHHATKATGLYSGSAMIGAAVDVIAQIVNPEPEPTHPVRKVHVVGRGVGHELFSMRYEAGNYVLEQGADAPLDVRVLEFIKVNPSCSRNAVLSGVKGGNIEIDRTVRELIDAGKVRNLGDSEHFALHATESQPTFDTTVRRRWGK